MCFYMFIYIYIYISCSPVDELPHSHYGDKWEGTLLLSFHIFYYSIPY